jgi:hypothetical protein
MNYEEAFNQTGWDLLGTFWWIGLIFVGVLFRGYAKWITPRKK